MLGDAADVDDPPALPIQTLGHHRTKAIASHVDRNRRKNAEVLTDEKRPRLGAERPLSFISLSHLLAFPGR